MTSSSDLGTAVLLVARPEQPEQAEAMREAGADAMRSDAPGRIVETAERLYRQFGHQKTTIADIARALSMSPANIYRFFRSKDAVNEAVCRRLLNDLVSVAIEVARRSATAADRLRALLLELARRNLERSRRDEQLHRLLAAAARDSWSIAAEHAARIESILAAVVADGMRRGEFRAQDPQRAGRCVHAAMTRYLHPTLIVDPSAVGRPMLDEMVDFCLAALR